MGVEGLRGRVFKALGASDLKRPFNPKSVEGAAEAIRFMKTCLSLICCEMQGRELESEHVPGTSGYFPIPSLHLSGLWLHS